MHASQGDLTNFFHSDYPTSTYTPYLAIDLGVARNVSRVRVYNRALWCAL